MVFLRNPAVIMSLLSLAQPAVASRDEFLQKPFVENHTLNFDQYRRFDLGETSRTLQFGDLCLPKAPIFHAYNISYDLRDPNRFGPKFPYNIQFPGEFYESLPASVTAQIDRLGIPRERVEIYCEVQDQPYRDDVQILFRPHSWTDPDAPYQDAKYRTSRSINVGLFEAPAGTPTIHFSARPEGAFFPAGISVHPLADGIVTSSGPNLAVDGLDYHTSQAVWSLTQLGGRVAATLHILLNDTDAGILESLAPQAGNLQELLQRMEASRLHGSAWLEALKRLIRPVEAKAADAGAAPAPPAPEATLWKGGPTRNLTIPMDGIAFEYQSAPCRPGDTFVGEAQVQAAAANRGRVWIGLRFHGDTKQNLGRGEAIPGQPMTAELAGKARLAVRGTAPDLANRVTFFIRTEGFTPWSRVTFDGLSFTRTDAPAPAAGPQPNLWKTTLKTPEKGSNGIYCSMPCAPGDGFTGQAQVQTRGLTRGKAQLGIVFQGGGKALRYGGPLGPAPSESASHAPVLLGVKGVAPAGTDTVQLYVQTFGCNPGAEATFDSVAFHRLPSGGSEPKDQPNLWKTTLKVPASGVVGEYQTLPCRPGEEFTGEGFIQTHGLTQGSARINLVFQGAGKPLRYGAAPGGGVEFESRQAGRIRVATRGTAPAGADSVQFYIQVYGGNPGALATFDSVCFQKRPQAGSQDDPPHPLGLESGHPASGLAVRAIPGELEVGYGEAFTLLSLVDRGRGPFKYRWLFHGVEMPDETGPNLLVSRATRSGPYQVEITNGAETAISPEVWVQVRPRPEGKEEKVAR